MGTPSEPVTPQTQPTVAPAFIITPKKSDEPQKILGEVLFICCMVLTQALASLNNGLRIVSTTVLAQDLQEDKSYADQISAIKLAISPPTTHASHATVASQNSNKLIMQQVIQARLKAHQNQEQIDIQGATTLSTDMQNLSAVFTAIMQLLGQIFSAIVQMTR